MTDTINDNTPKPKLDILDYPEPSADYNEKITEKAFEVHASKIAAARPKPTEWFRCYDPKGNGDINDIRKAVLIQLNVKGMETDFICFGDEDFYNRIKQEVGKVTVGRPAMWETSNGRTGIWFVAELTYSENGNANPWTATKNDILEKSLTKWVRIVSNRADGYYDGYFASDDKVAMYVEQGKPKFKMDYQECIKKAYQGFVLTPGNIDTDPHYRDMLGDKVQTEVKDQKGKKIS